MSNDMKGAPVTLWLDGKSQTVHPIDAPAWRENGWGEDPETVTPAEEALPEETLGEGEDSETDSAPAEVASPAQAPAKKGKATRCTCA